MVKTGWTDVSLKLTLQATTQALSDRTLHAGRRRLLNNAFSESALKNLEKYVVENIRRWCDHLDEPADNEEKESGWSKEKDIGVWATLLTVDILGDLCFGASFNAMQQGYSYITELLLASTTFQDKVSCNSWTVLSFVLDLVLTAWSRLLSCPFVNGSTRS